MARTAKGLGEYNAPSSWELESEHLNREGAVCKAEFFTDETGYVIFDGSNVCHLVGKVHRFLDRWWHHTLCGDRWADDLKGSARINERAIRVEEMPQTKRICGGCLRTRRARGIE